MGFKQYWKYLTRENARTVFEARTNMLRLNANYGQKDNICYKCHNVESEKLQNTSLNAKTVQMIKSQEKATET